MTVTIWEVVPDHNQPKLLGFGRLAVGLVEIFDAIKVLISQVIMQGKAIELFLCICMIGMHKPF